MTDPLTCMVAALWFEARQFYKEPDAIFAVADVIQNRVNDGRWPDTICAVVNQRKQFSFTHDGLSDVPRTTDEIQRRAMVVVKDIAARSINGERFGLTSTHYHTVDVSPFWTGSMPVDGKIGTHVFYTWE